MPLRAPAEGEPRRRAAKSFGTFKIRGAPQSLAALDKHNDPQWQARQAHILRSVWVGLAGLVLCGLGALAVLGLMSRPQPISTGDPLLNAFLQQCAERGYVLRRMSVLEGEWGAYGELSSEQAKPLFTALAADYADTSDFWLLSYYWRTNYRDKYLSETAGVELNANCRYLEEAQRRGLADWRIKLLLARSYLTGWIEEAEAMHGLQRPLRYKNSLPQEFADYYHAVGQAIREQHGAQYQRMLTELAAANPREAQAHILAANYAAMCDDYPAALAELRAANAAPHCDALRSYPLDLLARNAEQGADTGDRLLTGFLANLEVSEPLPNFIRTKDLFRLLAAEAIRRADWPGVETLHTYACRLGAAEGNTLIHSLVALNLANILYDMVSTQWPQPLSSAQLARLGTLKQKQDQLKGELKAISQAKGALYNNFIGNATAQQMILQQLQAMLDGGVGFRTLFLDSMRQDLLAEQQGQAGHVRQLWRELEQFDYTTLDWNK